MSAKWGDRIKASKQHLFVGRDLELNTFETMLRAEEQPERILYLYGEGGIGKSSLLDRFAAIAERFDAAWIRVDSRDFSSPEDFCRRLLPSLGSAVDFTQDVESLITLCLRQIALHSKKRRLVIAIDTFEEIGVLESWLREHFLTELTDDVIVVFAGRLPVGAGWKLAGWLPYMRVLRIDHFDRTTSHALIGKYRELSEEHAERLHSLTKGHPLTLALLLSLTDRELPGPEQDEVSDSLAYAAACWLREVRDPALHDLVEAAALVRIFNRELLEHMLDRKLSASEFASLTELSFVRQTKRGWYVHDLLRGPLSREARRKQPTMHERLRQRCVEYTARSLAAGASSRDHSLLALDLIYMLGDATIRSVFLDETYESGYYAKPLRAGQLAEADAYIAGVLSSRLDVVQQFHDPYSGRHYENRMPFSFIERAYRLLDLERWARFGEGVVQVICNDRHEAGSLIVTIPIHRESVPDLERSPVSRAYFNRLSDEERAALCSPAIAPAGWYIYHLDSWGDHSPPARSAMLQFILLLLLRGGLILHSSPLQMHRDVLHGLGFEEVPDASHRDYGDDFPASTFGLDLRGERRIPFLEHLLSNKSPSPDHPGKEPMESKGPSLTAREHEVSQLVLQGLTNAEIAQAIYVSEITVKKHLGNIYGKLGIKGKTQLVQHLLQQTIPDATPRE